MIQHRMNLKALHSEICQMQQDKYWMISSLKFLDQLDPQRQKIQTNDCQRLGGLGAGWPGRRMWDLLAGGEENVSEHTEVIVAQNYECTKWHQIIHMRWLNLYAI